MVPDIEKKVPDIEKKVPDIEKKVPDIEKKVPDIEPNGQTLGILFLASPLNCQSISLALLFYYSLVSIFSKSKFQ